jgi:acyl-coenzyme A thioesterase 9
MRVKTPWIEALTKSREDAQSSQTPRAQGKPDLTPKKMSDSYYSAILPLSQDKWLLDSYLNASGHIRYDYVSYCVGRNSLMAPLIDWDHF